MTAWQARPGEFASLFNPAFAAVLLREAAAGYQREDRDGIPFALCFLVLPLVLHKRTREAFPRGLTAQFHSWVEHQRYVKVNFAQRARGLAPITREGLLFGAIREIVAIRHARVTSVSLQRPWTHWPVGTEVWDCLESSLFVGRWLARAPDAGTTMALLGVRP